MKNIRIKAAATSATYLTLEPKNLLNINSRGHMKKYKYVVHNATFLTLVLLFYFFKATLNPVDNVINLLVREG